MRIYDSHAHLNDPQFKKDLEEVLFRAKQSGVERIFIPGYDIKSSSRAVELAKSLNFKASAGVHPHDAKNFNSETLKKLEQLVSSPHITAIGEIGLDFYKMYSPKEAQIRVFRSQLEIAVKFRLPVILHVRDAFEDVFRILSEYNNELPGGIFHCFSGGSDEAEEVLKFKNFYISFAGSITYRNSKAKRAINTVPLDRMLVETDSPYLTPSKVKGRNEPAYIVYTLKVISKILNIPLQIVAEKTYNNAVKILEF